MKPANSTRILVTGVAGFTGKALALRLAELGYNVRGTVRPDGNRRIDELVRAGIEVVESDIGSTDDLKKAIEGCSHIYHIAALFRRAGVPDDEYRRINRDGTARLIEVASESDVQKIVHCSTVGVCGDILDPPGDERSPYNPGDIYQLTKLEGEKIAVEAFQGGRIRGTVIRPASIYGPGDLRLLKLFRMIARERFLVIGEGEVGFHTVYIDDLLEGFILGMECEAADGGLFIIAGDRSVSLNELFSMIAKTVGAKPPKWRIPLGPMQLLGSLCEKVCIRLRIEPPIYRRRVDFFAKHREFDITRARNVLDYKPRVPLEVGLRRTAEWYRSKKLI